MLEKTAWVFAVVFIALGILGFIPGITTDGNLLGIFQVDATHNVIHLITGLVAAGAAMASRSRLFFQVFGVIYALVAIVGFAQGNTVLGIIDVNAADNILHTIIALVALYFGFAVKEGESSPGMAQEPPQPQQQPPQQNM